MTQRIDGRPGASDEGFALVAVLGFLVVVAAAITPFVLTARTHWQIEANVYRLEKMRYLADGLVEVLAARAMPPRDEAHALPLSSEPMACRAGTIVIQARLQEHASLIDLNRATPDLIALGLRALGIDGPSATSLASTIERFRSVAWRDDGNAPRDETPLKGGPFESVIELTDIAPLGRFSPDELGSAFTVHSGAGIVSTTWSSPALRRALAASRTDIEGLVNDSSERSPALTIMVVAEDEISGARAVVGYVVRYANQTQFNRIERLPSTSGNLATQSSTGNCSALFGVQVARVLEGVQ